MPEHRLKRLRYRAWHRGTKEMDIVLGGFVDAHGDGFSAGDIAGLERLLEESDTDLYRWIVSGGEASAAVDRNLVDRLRTYASSLGAARRL